MTVEELAAFIARRPTGALCVVDDGGRLCALPAHVFGAEGGVLTVEVSVGDPAISLAGKREGCVVADVFETYEGIRGVITRGPAECVDAQVVRPVVTLTMTRTTSFSFADAVRR